MTRHAFDQIARLTAEHDNDEHIKPAPGCPMCVQRNITRQRVMADVIRDWIHETPLSQCNMSADTCPDWPLAYELADLINTKLEESGRVAGVIPIHEGFEGGS